MSRDSFNSQLNKKENMITFYYLQGKGIIMNQIIKFTSVMEETPIELCC